MQAELQALLMAQPRALGHPRLRAAAESALNKLMAALPAPLREQAAAVRERLHIDPAGWWDTGEDLSVLPQLQDAVARERKLSFDYVRADGEKSVRTVDPLGLVAKGTSWYMVANTAKGMRTFRISRMEAVTVLAAGIQTAGTLQSGRVLEAVDRIPATPARPLSGNAFAGGRASTATCRAL